MTNDSFLLTLSLLSLSILNLLHLFLIFSAGQNFVILVSKVNAGKAILFIRYHSPNFLIVNIFENFNGLWLSRFLEWTWDDYDVESDSSSFNRVFNFRDDGEGRERKS